MVTLGLLLSGAAYAQSADGVLAGAVIDSTGAAIPGAKVTATSLNTNASRTVTTGSSGNYRLEYEQAGPYRIDVTAPSFTKTTVARANVSASVITSVNVTLKAGSAASTVEVTGEATALKTDSGELSETISGLEINTLPIANLNPYSLATTLPGVTTVTADDFTNGSASGASFAVNGSRPRDNNFLIEGVDNNDQGIHGQAFQPENLEAIAEATFLLSSFSAEYGRGGSISNIVFQSGTNQFHGAVFERLKNSALDATDHNDVLNGNPKVSSRENYFGFRIGGPIVRDRAFFFVSNLWDRERQTAHAGVLTVPTAAGYTALQQYATNPRIAALLQAYGGLVGTNLNYAVTDALGPDALGVDRGAVDFAGVQRSLAAPANSRELEATSDVLLNSKDKLRFRFVQAPLTIPYDIYSYPNQLPGFDTEQSLVTYNAGITETHIFNPNVLNELRLSWSRIGFDFLPRPEALANPLAIMPAISISGITGYGLPVGGVPQGRFQNTYQIQDALSLIKGRNTIKLGVDILDERIKDNIPFNLYGSIGYQPSTGVSALGNYLDDDSGPSAKASKDFGNPTARPEIWSQNYFVQDSYKVMPNLEVDGGLRYEYNGTPFNGLGYPAIDPNNLAAFPLTTKQIGDKNDIAPRLGFNYSPVANGKTVISGGVGVFYSHVFTNMLDNVQDSAPNAASKLVQATSSGRGQAGWSQYALQVCPTTTPPSCGISTTAASPTDTATVITPKLLDPLSYQYNLRVQQEFFAGMVASVAYVGNRGEHLYAEDQLNPFGPSGRVIPTRGSIIVQDNSADSNYNGLQLELEKKERHGLSLRAAYTYSKALDDESEIATDQTADISTFAEVQLAPRGREYGNSAFDHRQRLVVSGVYQLPVWHAEGGLRIASAIVNGFTLSGITSFQTGNPENVVIGYDWNADGVTNDRPILLNKNAPITHWAIQGSDFYNVPDGTLCDGPEALATNDPCKVVSPSDTHWVTSHYGTTGNTIGRNYLTTGHFSTTDLTVARRFKTFRGQDFSIRAEALNVLNQGNTGNYNANLLAGVPFNGTDTLGNVYSGAVTFANRALTTSGGRTLRIYARYEF